MVNQNLISIIIPVFNAERSIKQCLSSVLDQTYSRLEIILINDGSSDNSEQIILKYALKDKRIVYKKQYNKGVSSARNHGLDIAKGDYVCFLDSDDYLPLDSLENLLLGSQNFDFIFGSYRTFPDGASIGTNNQLLCENKNLKLCIQPYLLNFLNYSWGKLFKRTIIENYRIRFNELITVGEDTLFVNLFLVHVQTISIIKNDVYCYSQLGQGGLSRRNVQYDEFLMYTRVILDSYDNLEYKFKFDAKVAKANLLRFFIHRYISSFIAGNIFSVQKQMRVLFNHSFIREVLFASANTYKVGRLQKLIDTLAKNKMYFTLAIVCKMFSNSLLKS